MKKLKNLKDIKVLSKNEKKSISGGNKQVCSALHELCKPDWQPAPGGGHGACCLPYFCVMKQNGIFVCANVG